jgi:hypothetical protein
MDESERFVNYYSCSYDGALINQGWLYLSISYCCFHSSILGSETKVVIELKNIAQLSREKSKKGIVSDSIRITTKNKNTHRFSNLFNRDETFELLEYLVNVAMARLLNCTSNEAAPGLSFQKVAVGNYTSPLTVLDDMRGENSIPLREFFEIQKKKTEFQSRFGLPEEESIVMQSIAICLLSDHTSIFNGQLYISENFLCFNSSIKYQCQVSIPFCTIVRVEKIKSYNPSIALFVKSGIKIVFELPVDESKSSLFFNLLKGRLQENISNMKNLKSFLATCPSEDLIEDRELYNGGLGKKYGYLDTRMYAENFKTYWTSYFKGMVL